MSTIKQNFFSIVLVGKHNPGILNHEFLSRYRVLPQEAPFVRANLSPGENPFTDFFSTPPVARIAYGPFSLLVEVNRYQAMDMSGGDPPSSPIIEITKKYFGELLPHTPLTLAGLNLNCDLTLGSPDDERRLDSALGIERERCERAFAASEVSVSITVSFPLASGRMIVVVAKPKDSSKPIKLNLNYEFRRTGSMTEFLSCLDHVPALVRYCDDLCSRVRIGQ